MRNLIKCTSLIIYTTCRGKIVKKGQKLMVESWGGGITSLVPIPHAVFASSKEGREGREGRK